MINWVLTVKNIELSPDKEVSLITCNIEDEDFDFEEGQFLQLETIDYQQDGKSLKNPYSIASTHNHYLETKEVSFFTKKASEMGMSSYLTQKIKVGDKIKFHGPYGALTDDKSFAKYLFVAIGSGMAWIYGHYIHLTQEDPFFEKVVTLWGEKTIDEIVPSMKDTLTKPVENVKNILFLSRQDEIPAGFRKGHIQDGFQDALDALGDTNFQAFLCGKPEMVIEIQQKLLDAGLSDDQIHFEIY